MFTAQKYVDPSSAKVYSSNNDIQFHQAKDFIDAHGNLLTGPVLDIGSGDGKVTAYISNKICQPIIGVDISAERVKFANKKYGNNKIMFFVGDAARLNEAKEVSSRPYGTIVSFNTLHHVPSNMQSSVFFHTKKLLKNDGIALFLIPGRSPELHDSINETASNHAWKTYFLDFDLSKVRTYETPEYYKNLCIEAGFFHCDASSAYEKGGKRLDAKGVKDFLSGWLPHLAYLKSKNIDQTIQNKFLDDIVDLYFTKMNKKSDETVEPKINQNRIIAYASKVALFNSQRQNTNLSSHSDQVVKLRSRL